MPARGGPGQRYVVGSEGGAEGETVTPQSGGALPEAYGTKRLVTTARDPYWLFAHWDLTREQLVYYNGLSADGHLVLRVHRDEIGEKPYLETHVHPESRTWFVNVGLSSTRFLGELGYYAKNGDWERIAISSPTLTPPDRMSDDTSVWFETLPMDLDFRHLVELVRAAVSDNIPLMEAIQQLRKSGHEGLPDRRSMESDKWTEAQWRALAEVVTRDAARRIWMGSLEITELIRRQFHQQLFSAAASQFGLPSSWSGAVSSFSSVTSPYGGEERKRGFWFNVNAELIIYGATEPDAKVTIGGRPIKLRPDGTFSYRFSLPDGEYDLPAEATAADQSESRRAELRFSRSTQYFGEVGKHPQDPALKPPLATNVS